MNSERYQLVIFTTLLFGTTALAAFYTYLNRKSLLWWLRAQAAIVGVALVYLSVLVFQPMLTARTAPAETQHALALPAYDYQPWQSWPVQVDGRTKPFETAAIEALREITGRAKFREQPAVPIVLQWMLSPSGSDADGPFVDWENTPFILCDHQGLRKRIYEHLATEGKPLTAEQLYGRYISPSDLRDSPGLKQLLGEAARISDQDREKASQRMTPEQHKAREVAQRLSLLDSITQRDSGQGMRHEDPFHVAVLDPVHSGPWFSFGELRQIKDNDKQWYNLIYERLSRTPQLYIGPEQQHALEAFQAQIKDGHGLDAIDELAAGLRARSDRRIKEMEEMIKSGNVKGALHFFDEVARTEEQRERVVAVVHSANSKNRDEIAAGISRELRAMLEEHDQQVIDELRGRVRAAQQAGYRPDKQEFRMLHLNYLENRFPDLYSESVTSRPTPTKAIDQLLASRAGLVGAYRSGDVPQFNDASGRFLDTVRTISENTGPYPGEDTVAARMSGLLRGRPTMNPGPDLLKLEVQYNHADPFTWAWVVMLGSIVFFIASLALHSRSAYALAFAFYLAALGVEAFGFYARIAIAGRPPVSNMYETLIWVSFMSAAFALVLELIYRRKVIGLAGAIVSTLSLVLAAQLPVDLGIKINPIVPVLRSNYWLTIHVLTIVSSYAAGTLAWGMGNLSLVLLTFGTPRRETVKMLSKFTYRAVQIAVLLLAAGTFLGGWWAVDSWGRFWGWDPKEVWALIALVCYVIPLHARYIGWVKDFGLAVAAVVCYAAIVMSWYGVNFVLAAGLHSYGFGSGSPWLAFWCGLLNLEWVLIASMLYLMRTAPSGAPAAVEEMPEEAMVG